MANRDYPFITFFGGYIDEIEENQTFWSGFAQVEYLLKEGGFERTYYHASLQPVPKDSRGGYGWQYAPPDTWDWTPRGPDASFHQAGWNFNAHLPFISPETGNLVSTVKMNEEEFLENIVGNNPTWKLNTVDLEDNSLEDYIQENTKHVTDVEPAVMDEMANLALDDMKKQMRRSIEKPAFGGQKMSPLTRANLLRKGHRSDPYSLTEQFKDHNRALSSIINYPIVPLDSDIPAFHKQYEQMMSK